MYLSQPSDESLTELMSWFSTEAALSLWSGNNFILPFDLNTFKSDLKLEYLPLFALLSAQVGLLGFGQYYLRLSKCRLCRPVINPSFRDQGIAAHLIQQLTVRGRADLNTNSCSLFVVENNASAIKIYQKSGFTFACYPEKITLKDCLYMISD
ncbi:GNAT family N-acetyltransferase [Colwellia sp. C1TZA3]|uniref:GNAT family N-acetyltransferase n=1 Tax=Colwellia sp. C1TZA3 TaxID=2508879 RepID=UPI0011B9FF3C|nr:GNAT family N-acetyltransferase [Colwellia sp. C1TZA3]TWX73485.1 GNAT family N-acetyltransferase [Colwellia sp. C1TZA3]